MINYIGKGIGQAVLKLKQELEVLIKKGTKLFCL
jgi:hypothetical protein